MHAYLARLGIRPEVQQFFEPFYQTGPSGCLCFAYGRDTEIYGLAFHRVPSAEYCWMAGNGNLNLVRTVMICSSALEAIAWLNCNLAAFNTIENTLFLATGNNLSNAKLKWIREKLPHRKYALLFDNDLLGRVCDLKAASVLRGHPANISFSGDSVWIGFRHKMFQIDCNLFSLNAFERLSGYRFNVQTLKPGLHVSWLSQLAAQSFTT